MLQKGEKCEYGKIFALFNLQLRNTVENKINVIDTNQLEEVRKKNPFIFLKKNLKNPPPPSKCYGVLM